MPMPTGTPISIPEGFDPEKHCGALTVGDTPCMRAAGAGVPEYALTGRGGGRCSNHGGRGGRPIIHGGYSAFTESFAQLVEEQKANPALLDMRDEIAFIKVVMDNMKQRYAQQLEEYYEARRVLEAMDVSDPSDERGVGVGPLDLPPMPELNLEMIKTMEKVITAQHNMDYAKQFSIPKREVIGIVEQINLVFAAICDDFELGEKVKVEFAKRLRGVQISKDGTTTAEARGLVRIT